MRKQTAKSFLKWLRDGDGKISYSTGGYHWEGEVPWALGQATSFIEVAQAGTGFFRPSRALVPSEASFSELYEQVRLLTLYTATLEERVKKLEKQGKR